MWLKKLLFLLNLSFAVNLIAMEEQTQNYYQILGIPDYTPLDNVAKKSSERGRGGRRRGGTRAVVKLSPKDPASYNAWHFLRDKSKKEIYDKYLPMIGHQQAVELTLEQLSTYKPIGIMPSRIAVSNQSEEPIGLFYGIDGYRGPECSNGKECLTAEILPATTDIELTIDINSRIFITTKAGIHSIIRKQPKPFESRQSRTRGLSNRQTYMNRQLHEKEMNMQRSEILKQTFAPIELNKIFSHIPEERSFPVIDRLPIQTIEDPEALAEGNEIMIIVDPDGEIQLIIRKLATKEKLTEDN